MPDPFSQSAQSRLYRTGDVARYLSNGDLDFSGPKPKVKNQRNVVTSAKPMKVYHADWGPGGRYLAFSRGPKAGRLGHAPEIVGIPAKGWDIFVADATRLNHYVQITTDGKCNKEPDWVPVPKESR